MHVRDQFYKPNQTIKRSQSAAEIGPSILLQDVYPEDLTAAFGGKVRLRDEFTIKKRLPHDGTGYMERAYVDAKADMYHASRFKDIGEPEFYDKATDTYFHMYRPWRVHLPPTYASTWQQRYEKGIQSDLNKSAALIEARRRDHTTQVLSGDYRSPTYWNARFGEDHTYAPYVKNPYFLSNLHYEHAKRGY